MVLTMSTKTKPQPKPKPDAMAIRRWACDALCDPRSLQRELEHPGSVRGAVGERIRVVLEQRGLREPKEVA